MRVRGGGGWALPPRRGFLQRTTNGRTRICAFLGVVHPNSRIPLEYETTVRKIWNKNRHHNRDPFPTLARIAPRNLHLQLIWKCVSYLPWSLLISFMRCKKEAHLDTYWRAGTPSRSLPPFGHALWTPPLLVQRERNTIPHLDWNSCLLFLRHSDIQEHDESFLTKPNEMERQRKPLSNAHNHKLPWHFSTSQLDDISWTRHADLHFHVGGCPDGQKSEAQRKFECFRWLQLWRTNRSILWNGLGLIAFIYLFIICLHIKYEYMHISRMENISTFPGSEAASSLNKKGIFVLVNELNKNTLTVQQRFAKKYRTSNVGRAIARTAESLCANSQNLLVLKRWKAR